MSAALLLLSIDVRDISKSELALQDSDVASRRGMLLKLYVDNIEQRLMLKRARTMKLAICNVCTLSLPQTDQQLVNFNHYRQFGGQ